MQGRRKINFRLRSVLTALVLGALFIAAFGYVCPAIAATSPTTPLAITVIAAGDDYNGDPKIGLMVNGTQVAAASVTAVHSRNSWQTLNFKVTVSAVPQTIGISFLNDAYGGTGKDRNLYIKNIVVNGTTLLPQQGTYLGATGSVELNRDGTLSWNVAGLFNNPPPSAACGSTPSGQTAIKTISTTPGSIAATTQQCPFGGTQPTTVTVTQIQLCTNGTFTNQGAQVSTTTDTGSPTCNAAKACGSTPSGSTVTETISTTAGSIAATTAQCPNGGTQPTKTTVTQVQLCTNGTLANQGAQVSTTVNNGSPVCNAQAAISGVCGSANGVGTNTAPTTGLCSAGTASALSGAGPWGWTCVGSNGGSTANCTDTLLSSTGGNCAHSANGYTDGCAQAAAGVVPFPSMLSSYKARPQWDVAGVDYYVGIPSNVTLQTPASANLPVGCSMSGSAVTCSGSAAIVLNGFNFTNITLNISAANITVESSLFVVGSNQGSLGKIINITSSAGNVTFLNNEVNGSNIAVTAQQGQTVNISNSGTDTFKYNYFHNSGGDMIDFNTGTRTDIFQYNLFKDIGVNTAHADTIQWYGSVEKNDVIAFNTIYQTVNQPGAGMGGLNTSNAGSTAAMSYLSLNNNTVIQLAACTTCNWTLGIAGMGATDANPGDHGALRDNYIDPTGALGYTGMWLYPNGYYGSLNAFPNPTVIANTVNMVTGSTYTTYPKAQSYFVVPDVNGYTPPMIDVYSTTVSGSTITFYMDAVYTVTGSPIITFSNGSTATYASGSGTSTLTFNVSSGSASASATITAFNLNNGSIKDNIGNPVYLGVTATNTGNGGGTTPPAAVNGACGSANGTTVASKPTTNLCATGTTSAVSGSGPWNWTCAGSNGGSTASCSAQITTVTPQAINGVCGSMNGATTNVVPTSNLCSAGTASPVIGAGPWDWSCMGTNGGTTAPCSANSATGTQPAGASCPKGSAYADGCANAQASGSVQITNFFSGYTGTSYGHRPPWNVAAVDYPVGYSGTLLDPTVKGNLPSCASISGSGSGPFSVTVNSACTLTHLDFSLYNGICVTSNASSGAVIFDNDKFGWGTNCNGNGGDLLSIRGAANVTVQYSHFAGAHTSDANLQDLIGLHASNVVTVEYSAFMSPDQAGIQAVSGSPTLNVTHNYVENIACCGAHGDWVIGYSQGAFTYNDDFDTVFAGSSDLTTDCYITNASGSTSSVTGHCRHNVLVGATNAANGYLVELSPGGLTVNAFDVSNNYLATALTYGYYADVGSGGTVNGPITCSGNIDMLTGAAATGSLGPASCTSQ